MAKYILSDIFQGNFSISQVYGNNVDFYKNISKDAAGNPTLVHGHEGVDWATPLGSIVISPFNGIILRAEVNSVYGNTVVVWDKIQKCAVWFCHLQDIKVTKGQSVTVGQELGHTGASGRNVTGPHCHVNFVETDDMANRLNMNNGSLGFLNILDPNLVEWRLKLAPAPEAPVTKEIIMKVHIPIGDDAEDYIPIKKSDFQSMRGKCDLYDPMDAAGYHQLSDVDSKIALLTEEKQTLSITKEREVTALNGEIEGFKKDVESLNKQMSSLMVNYQKRCDEDTATISSSLREGKALQERNEDVAAIASILRVKSDRPAIVSALSVIVEKANNWDKQVSLQNKIVAQTKETVISAKSFWERLFGIKF